MSLELDYIVTDITTLKEHKEVMRIKYLQSIYADVDTLFKVAAMPASLCTPVLIENLSHRINDNLICIEQLQLQLLKIK